MSYKLKNLSDWRQNIATESVQNNDGTFGGDFLSSETLVLFSGPASLGATTGDISQMVPIGLVQSVQVSQQKQIQQLFEIGSKKPYFIPGRNIIGGGIGRVLFDGPSLMYSMYLRKKNGDHTAMINPDAEPYWKSDQGAQDHPTNFENGVTPTLGEQEVNFKTINGELESPNYFFMNLSSSFFHRPTGLGFVLFDAENEPYGGFYLENCYIQSHAFSVSSQQTILMEQVSFRASSIRPFDAGLLTPSTTP